MGGEGSGRKPDVTNAMLGQRQPAHLMPLATTSEPIFTPNYSGLKDSIRKTSTFPASGRVIFSDGTDFVSDGDITFSVDTLTVTKISSTHITGGDITLSGQRIGINTSTPDSSIEIETSSGDQVIRMDNNAASSVDFSISNGAGNNR